MHFQRPLSSLLARITMVIGSLAAGGLLGYLVVADFVIGTVVDPRANVAPATLRAAADYFTSARLSARLAREEMKSPERNLDLARTDAVEAARLSPNNHQYRVLLASVEESRGDRPTAEAMLVRATELAPANVEPRWRLANLRVRMGKLRESLEDFNRATTTDGSLLPATLDLLWRVTGGNHQVLEAATPREPKQRIVLARFLLRQGRAAEAVAVYSAIDRAQRLALPDSPSFIERLISAGHLPEARRLWLELSAADDVAGLTNPGFESEPVKGLAQFDWQLSTGDYARIAIDAGTARTGSRSLRVAFAGRDTTKLDNEVRQLLVVEPEARYRLSCWVKTEKLVTPEGPRLVVTDRQGAVLGSSEAIAAGSGDWTRLFVEFDSPESSERLNVRTSPGSSERLNVRTFERSAVGVVVALKRKPRFSYDDPTSGVIWLDDFELDRGSVRTLER